MNFEYTSEQQLIAESVRKYLEKNYDFELRQKRVQKPMDIDRHTWTQFADMGLLGLGVAPLFGGLGGGANDWMPVMEVMGESLVLEALIDHVGFATRLLARSALAYHRNELLPRLMDGSLVATFAYLEPEQRIASHQLETTAVAHDLGWKLNGKKTGVMGLPQATAFLIAAQLHSGVGLFWVDASSAGIHIDMYQTYDGRVAADVSLKHVVLDHRAYVNLGEDCWPWIEEAIDYSSALLCADALGAMKCANDLTVQYVKERKQFGVTIGSFQALQHRMVDLLMAYEQSKSMTILAVCSIDEYANSLQQADMDKRKTSISAAMVCLINASRLISQECVQLHGAMGMSDEMKISHIFRRLTAFSQMHGDIDEHLDRYTQLMYRDSFTS